MVKMVCFLEIFLFFKIVCRIIFGYLFSTSIPKKTLKTSTHDFHDGTMK